MNCLTKVLLCMGWLAAASGLAQASDSPSSYPDHSIRLIVPFAPGGGTDNIARVMARYLGDDLKQAVVVQNVGGGGGTIGAQMAVSAKPDGYTLILGAASYGTNAALYRLPYDALSDITPIAMIARTGYVVVANPASHIGSLARLVAFAKANPGKLDFGSSGVGSLSHLGMVLFEKMTGITMTHVPYKGIGPATTDLLAGRIQLMLGDVSASIPLITTKQLTPIAVTTATRMKALPTVPAVAETVPKYHVELWFAIWGPRGLPAPVVERVNAAVARVWQLPEVKRAMSNQGLEPWNGPPALLYNELKADITKWIGVLKEAGIERVAP